MKAQAVSPQAERISALVRRFFTDRKWREDAVAAYASVGVVVFVTSFFWACSRDFMHVVYALAFFVPVLVVLILRRPQLKQYGGWFTGLALIYAGYASLSTLWSEVPRPEFFAQHLLFLAVWLAGTAWLASRDRLDIGKICRYLIITGAVASVVYQIIFLMQSQAGCVTDSGSRLALFGYGVARNPNTIGLVFGSTTLLAYVWWLEGKGRRESLIRFLLFLLNVAAVLATNSRGPVLALAFTLAVGFSVCAGPSRKWRTHLLAAVLLFGGATFAIQHQAIPNRWAPTSLASSFRPQIWQHVIMESGSKHPIIGRGLVKTTRIHVPGLEKELPYTHHAHNAYLDAFYWTGIIGLALMLAHLFYTMWHWSNSPLILPVFLWLLFGCLTALFDRPGFFEHLSAHWFGYWIPAGLIGAFVTARRDLDSRTIPA